MLKEKRVLKQDLKHILDAKIWQSATSFRLSARVVLLKTGAAAEVVLGLVVFADAAVLWIVKNQLLC